jgi:hypothetical protein
MVSKHFQELCPAVIPINASTTVEANTRFYVKLLTTSNTTSTTTTAAADKVDYVVRIRKEVWGFDLLQSRYTRTSLGHRGYQATIKGALDSCPWISRPGLTAKNVMSGITLCVNYQEYG